MGQTEEKVKTLIQLKHKDEERGNFEIKQHMEWLRIEVHRLTKDTMGDVGRPPQNNDDISSFPREKLGSTGTDYTIARLERDGHHELAEAVLSREMSAAEGWRQAGKEKPRWKIRMDDPHLAAKVILEHMEPSAIAELCAILAQAIAERTSLPLAAWRVGFPALTGGQFSPRLPTAYTL